MIYFVYMLIGAHVSAKNSLLNAPHEAAKLGCEVFQIFSRPPYGGSAPKFPDTIGKEFKAACKTAKQKACYIHAPYFVQLASIDNKIYYGAISALKRELEVGDLLGADFVMTHIGSAKDLPSNRALDLVVKGLGKVFEGYQPKSCEQLLEMSAGAGNVIGDTFEELEHIITSVKKKFKIELGVCLDTQHSFASGYDWRTKQLVDKNLANFDRVLGLDKLKLIHLNDSKPEFNSHVDRHEHIGKGKIGLEGFEALLAHPALKDINLILETPHDTELPNDIALLKKLRNQVV